jgi:predicted nucleic acid-binding protein
MIVLDTNVVSEFMKAPADRSQRVFAWLQRIQADLVFTTTITLAEIAAGLLVMPAGKRRSEKEAAASRIFSSLFANRILGFDQPAAWAYADAVMLRRRNQLEVDPLDLQIAAIARSKNMAVATRSVSDFQHSGATIINPWD